MTRGEKTVPSNESFVVRQPLKLYRSKKRRYVRLEISAPLTFAPIDLDRPLSEVNSEQTSGSILNISGGGVLIDTTVELSEDSFIIMNLELTDCEILNGIVGKIKRVDGDGAGNYLVGIEFCSETALIETFGGANIGSLITSFDEKVKRYLLKYIFTKKVNARVSENESE